MLLRVFYCEKHVWYINVWYINKYLLYSKTLNLQNQSKYFLDWLLSREKSTVICDFLLCFKFHILLSLNLISSVF